MSKQIGLCSDFQAPVPACLMVARLRALTPGVLDVIQAVGSNAKNQDGDDWVTSCKSFLKFI